MTTGRAIATTLAIGAVMIIATSAHAFMMSLGGPNQLMGPGGALSDEGADALYAVDHFGREIKIAEADVPGPDGIVLQDLGVPSIDDAGNVWFAAAILEGRQLRWRIFSANPDAPLSDPVARTIPAASHAGEIPVMRVDPRPVPAGDGSVIFSSELARGGDAVFRVSADKLIRVVGTGARLGDGRVIRKIIFGTVQPAGQGQVVLSAYLAPGGQAELLVSESGAISVIAAEGAAAPDGTHYHAGFGPPAAISAGREAMVAFSAHTDRSDGVFLYNGGTTRQMLSTGERCRRGSVSYVSTERPGLEPDGTVAVLASCSGTQAIFLVDDGGARTVVRAQQQADYPGQFSQLGGPQLSQSGTVVFGAIGSDHVDRLFAISRTGRVRRLAPRELERFDRPVLGAAAEISHTVFAATLSISQNGTIAYLGGR
jgi:hypothetical protein